MESCWEDLSGQQPYSAAIQKLELRWSEKAPRYCCRRLVLWIALLSSCIALSPFLASHLTSRMRGAISL